jgi:nucleotide-binding universal stress UspA family protein
MYKRIMVAVDESFMTDQVLHAAIELAQVTGAKLAICHAIDETILAQREVAMMLPNSVGKTEARLLSVRRLFSVAQARAVGVDAEVRIVDRLAATARAVGDRSRSMFRTC